MMTIGKYLRRQKSKNPLRYFTRKIIYILLFVLALVFTVMVISISSNGSNTGTYYFGVRPTLIITGSMEPTIMTNAIVMVEPVKFEDVEVGDIIRYNSDSGISIVHRVVEKHEEYVITKGDNNMYEDNELVFYPKLNGRIAEINNEVAPIVTSLFGKFDPTDMTRGTITMLLGFIKMALVVTALICMGVFIFEIFTINGFWLKKQEKMGESLNWVKNRTSGKQFNCDVDNYKRTMKLLKWHFIKKLILKIRFRKYYNKMCNEEKEVLATAKARYNFTKGLIHEKVS